MRSEHAARWVSVHLYHDGEVYGHPSDATIRVSAAVKDVVTTSGEIDAFFFLRYRDAIGPHVRLRLRRAPDGTEEQLVASVEGCLRAHGLERRDAKTPSIGSHGFRWERYEPEWTRYGGAGAMASVETFFQRSSEYALTSLQLGPEDRSRRLGQALMATVACVHAFQPDGAVAAASLAAVREGMLRQLIRAEGERERVLGELESRVARQSAVLCEHVEELWTRLATGEDLPPRVAAYHGAARDLAAALHALGERLEVNGRPGKSWTECVDWILPSLTHMTSNRLGISQFEEAYLARIVELALAEITAEAAT